MSADSLKSYNLSTEHKLRYFYPEDDLSSVLGRVQKHLDLNPSLYVTDLNVKGYYDSEEEKQLWEATLTYLEGWVNE